MNKTIVGLTVLAADLHLGSTMAMLPPGFINDQGIELKSRWIHQWLYEAWMDIVGKVKGYKTLGAKVLEVFNGDLTENSHHNTVQIVTSDVRQHALMAEEILTPMIALADAVVFTKGTPAHAGEDSELEKGIATYFNNRNLIKPPYGFVHDVFKGEFMGMRLNVAHHVQGGKTDRSRWSAMVTVVANHILEAGKQGVPKAHYLVRAHNHRFVDTDDMYETRGIGLPCLQFPTSFINRVAADTLPHIGGVFIKIYSDGTRELEQVLYPIVQENASYPLVTLGGLNEKAGSAKAVHTRKARGTVTRKHEGATQRSARGDDKRVVKVNGDKRGQSKGGNRAANRKGNS